jgi:hypothetical protein
MQTYFLSYSLKKDGNKKIKLTLLDKIAFIFSKKILLEECHNANKSEYIRSASRNSRGDCSCPACFFQEFTIAKRQK